MGVGWLAFFFVLIHFCFIVIYALPDQFSKPALKTIAAPYVEPVFTQKWSMFAPCPTVNGHIKMQFCFEDDTTAWIDPTAEAYRKHGFYRGSYHGELVLAESNLIYWLQLDLNAMGIGLEDEFPADRLEAFQKGWSYFKIKNYLEGNARYFFGKSPVSARLWCSREDVVTHEKGELELPMFYY